MTISDVFMVKSLWAGIGKAGVRAAGTALATRIGRGGGAELAEEGLISFGQKRIAPTFRLYSEASESIRGRSLVEVAEGLKAGNISPNELPVSYFVHEGKKIAVNNRGLAALRMAGMEPTIATRVPATTELLERLAERPIDSFHRIPGLRIAVTNEKSGAGHLYTVITR
jgi:hypothetical protein